MSVRETKRLLVWVIAIVVAAHLALPLLRHLMYQQQWFEIISRPEINLLVKRFDLDTESSFPTWFSAIELLGASCLLAVIAHAKRREGDLFARHWKWLAGIFCYLSIDEIAQIHDSLKEPVQRALHALPSAWNLGWVVPFALLVAVVFATYLRFLRSLPQVDRRRFLLAGFVYVAGAMGMEIVGIYLVRHHAPYRLYFLEYTLEETMEMVGSAMFIVALLSYLRRYISHVSIDIFSETPPMVGNPLEEVEGSHSMNPIGSSVTFR